MSSSFYMLAGALILFVVLWVAAGVLSYGLAKGLLIRRLMIHGSRPYSPQDESALLALGVWGPIGILMYAVALLVGRIQFGVWMIGWRMRAPETLGNENAVCGCMDKDGERAVREKS